MTAPARNDKESKQKELVFSMKAKTVNVNECCFLRYCCRRYCIICIRRESKKLALKSSKFSAQMASSGFISLYVHTHYYTLFFAAQYFKP